MAVTVTTAATKIHDSSVDAVSVRVHNTGSTSCDVSKSPGVTAGAGFAVAAGAEETFALEPGEQLFGICASGSTTVQVL